MSIGIVVSTELEARLIIGRFAGRETSCIQHKTFYTGDLAGTRAVVCVCGIGKTNAAHGTTLLLEKFGPALVYCIGVAGAYPSSGLAVGDAVVGEKEVYGDEGLSLGDGFCTMDALGLPLLSCDGVGRYYNEFPLLVPAGLRGFKARGVFLTVSACTGTAAKGRDLERRFNALCENMEGAAVAHICALNRIQVVEIRGISNLIEDRTATPLDRRHIATAARNAQDFFLATLHTAFTTGSGRGQSLFTDEVVE